MASKSGFPLVRGRKMRVTRLDGCGNPIYSPDTASASVVTDGFVSVAATAQTTEAEVIEVTNANGKICARDAGTPEFNGYSLEITFCDVQPCTFEIMTGQKPVKDATGATVGFKMNSAIDQTALAFALEIWAGVPGVACGPDSGGASAGYILFPYLSSGTVGDFTIENAAVNFVISGAATKDGNNWGAGPYEVVPDADGDPAVLPELLDGDDHLYVSYTTILPPENTVGCVPVPEPAAIPLTGVTAGAPGSFVPGNATRPANLAALKADPTIGDTGTSKPTTAWTAGQWVELGDGSSASWNATAWVAGVAVVAAARETAKAKRG